MNVARADSATRALIVDRHPVTRRGLAREIEPCPALEVAGTTGELDEGLLLAQELHPDVVVFGVTDGAADAVDATRSLRAVGSGIAVLVFGGTERLGRAAVAAGASGYVAKTVAVPLVIEAILAVGRGETVVAPSPGTDRIRADAGTERGAGDGADGDGIADGAPPLTRREWEVLHLLDAGCNAARIGERLFISRNTARNYVQSVLTKLGAHSKLEAVAIARRAGLFDRV